MVNFKRALERTNMAKGQEKETAVATTKQESKAVDRPVDLGKLAQDAQEFGMSFDRQDLAVPFLRIVQANSPQVIQGQPQFLEEAKPGMFLNTASNQLWDGREGVYFLPVTYQRSYIEWRPRERGGGFVKDHGSDGEQLLKTTKRNEKNRDILPNGNELQTAALYYGYLVEPNRGKAQQVALVLAGTQLKKSRKFNTALETATIEDPETNRKVKLAPFYRLWKLTSIPESNDKGHWFGIQLDPAMPILEVPNGEQIYAASKKLHQLVKTGEVKTQEPTRDSADEMEESDKVPF
jgi:hypothetical protein